MKSAELEITLRTDRETALRMKDRVPGLRLRSGGCEIRITNESPGRLAEKAKEVLERIGAALE